MSEGRPTGAGRTDSRRARPVPTWNSRFPSAPAHPVSLIRISLLALAAVFLAPVAVSTALYLLRERGDWRLADRSSAGLLPAARTYPGAVVRIFSARTVSWRGILASHAWIVIKGPDERVYRRFDYTAWGGEPIWIDRFVPDGRWFGNVPEVVFAADGADAEAMLPRIRQAVAEYRYARPGDYVVWPGPNSNTFVAAVMAAVPEIRTSLPPTAVGKDFPYDGRWIGRTPSGTGVRINLGGYLGLTVGWIEGLELNLLGGVAGIDLRRPAIKLPALGRVGV